MQIEIMDRIAFSVVSGTCVNELVKVHPDWDGRAIKRNARPRFTKMLRETPSIGSHRQNCIKMNLTGDPICDYLYTRPGSEIEKQWKVEHLEGTFNSK